MLKIPDSNLIDSDWLNVHLTDPEIVIFDCRYNLQDPSQASQAYHAGHIPGAYRLDMETDLAGPVGIHGGRHPLPKSEVFSARLRECGVTDQSLCVAYDEDGSGAARLWWLLRYFGHDRVALLNGGITEWKIKALPVSKETPNPRAGTFVARPHSLPTVSMHDLAGPHRFYLMDSRNAVRYRGEKEPLDIKAGHIPGARPFDYQKVFQAPARYHPADFLTEHFADVPRDGKVVVYCGSGVTACVNLFALSQVGIEGTLYPGSWSDWISYQGNPVATGERENEEGS